MKMNGWAVIGYCSVASLIHIGFIVYIFTVGSLDCSRDGFDIEDIKVELFLIWCIVYFPLLICIAFYTLLFRMCRSFLCSCWECCGNDVNGKNATGCKICFEGIFGNPLLFCIVYIAWGIYEWIVFDNCTFEIQYGYIGDILFVTISLILLCVYYFVRVRRRFKRKRNANIAKKYADDQEEDRQIAAYNENDNDDNNGRVNNNIAQPNQPQIQLNGYNIQAPPQREGAGGKRIHQPDRRFSAQPQRNNNNLGNVAPAYAASAHGIAPYNPAQDRRHSYNPGAKPHGNMGPAYAASAHGIAPYKPGQQPRRGSYNPNAQPVNPNPLILNKPLHQQNETEASIEISVSFGDDNDPAPGKTRRGPSLSFPAGFKGHARRVSSGILKILMQIDAEPECAICMCELEKGDEMAQLECGHTYHKECVVDWFGDNSTCPVCRAEMKK